MMRTLRRLIVLAVVLSAIAAAQVFVSTAPNSQIASRSNDGKLLYIAADGVLLVFSTPNGLNGSSLPQLVQKITFGDGVLVDGIRPTCLAVTSDGTFAVMQVLVFSDAGQVSQNVNTTVVANLATGLATYYPTPNPESIVPVMGGGCATIQNGKVLLGASAVTPYLSSPPKLGVFNPATGQIEQLLDNFALEVESIVAVPSTSKVVVFYGQQLMASMVEILDTSDMSEVKIQLPFSISSNPTFSPDNTKMYLSGTGGMVVVDLASYALTTLPNPNSGPSPFIGSDGDSTYVIVSGDNTFGTLDLATSAIGGLGSPSPYTQENAHQMFVSRNAELNTDDVTVLLDDELSFSSFERPQPLVSAAVNSATFLPPVAAGNWFTLFGRNLGCQVAVPDPTWQAQNPNVPFPIKLGCAQLFLDYNSKPVPLTYVSPNQVNALLPTDAPTGTLTGTVQLPNADGTTASAAFTVNVVPFAPGFYAQVGTSGGVLTAAANPLQAGNTVTAYVAGLGPTTDQALQTGQPAPFNPLARTAPSSKVTVTVGGAQAQVLFSGLTPGTVGLGQVNYVIPSDLAPGPRDAVVSVNGISSPVSQVLIQ